ncbi:MAG TPA: hypothetical protein VK395_37345 [Gemmataceae bacterium]|nr:hypothetical protein [Gemmataceae bacterium]
MQQDWQPMWLLVYCAVSNHSHLVVWPRGDWNLSAFMRWLTVTYTQHRQALTTAQAPARSAKDISTLFLSRQTSTC